MKPFNLQTMFPLTVSNSSLGSMYSCEFKWYRSNVQKLQGTVTNPDLLAGGIIAKACELARIDFYTNKVTEDEAVEKAVEYILRSPDTGHPVKTNERIAYTFRKYIASYPFEGSFRPARLVDGTSAIEYRFELDLGIPHPDLPDRTIKYTGVLDGVFERLHQGKVVKTYVVDEKTTGRISRVQGTKAVDLEREADIFRTDRQMISYCYVMNKLGLRVDSALIRRIPILNTHEPAFELDIPITKYMMGNWYRSTVAKVTELVEKYKYYKEELEAKTGRGAQEAFYPSYGTSCNAYNRPCIFREGCMYPEGEERLATTMIQVVRVRKEDGEYEQVALDKYKKQLNIED